MGVQSELTFCIHLNTIHENVSEPPFLTNLHSHLANVATGCCFWQLPFTGVHRTILHLIPTPLVFPTPNSSLDLIRISKIEIAQKNSNELNMRPDNFYLMPPSQPVQWILLLVFSPLCGKCPFTMRPTRPYLSLEPASEFPVLRYRFILVTRYPFCYSHFEYTYLIQVSGQIKRPSDGVTDEPWSSACMRDARKAMKRCRRKSPPELNLPLTPF